MAIKNNVKARIKEFSRIYSRFDPTSMVSQISKRAGTYQLPPDSGKLFTLYRRLYDATNGEVTPLIGGAMNQAGYDATYSFKPRPIHTIPSWDDVLHYNIHTSVLTAFQAVTIDVGAAGKGYLVDMIGNICRALGVQYFCVDAGGDMIIHVEKPIRIGLEHPYDPTLVIGFVELYTGSICGSASNRRVWGGMHHIIRPSSRTPESAIKATWAIASTALEADGLATALFFVAPEILMEYGFMYNYAVFDSQDVVSYSKYFPGVIFGS